MVFTTIDAAPQLSTAQRRLVARSGPSAVLTRTSYPSLLASAGFSDIRYSDVTDEYRTTQQAWADVMRREAPAISAAMGEPAFEQRLADRTAALAALDAGLLKRSRFSAIRS